MKPVVRFFLLLTAFLSIAFFRNAEAATYLVDTTADDLAKNDCVDATPNDCSLRGAIGVANETSGADVITLPAGTYKLTVAGTDDDLGNKGDLDITSDLTINGAGAKTTIVDGNSLDRVFHIDPAGTAAPTVTINDLTVTGGLTPPSFGVDGDGGGLWINGGTVALNRLIVRDNRTGPFELGAGIAIKRATTNVTISRCTIEGNAAGDGTDNASSPLPGGSGGGLMLDNGTVLITNTTIAGNRTGDGGNATTAAGAHGGDGAGFILFNGTVTLNNDTITGNVAGAGGSGTSPGRGGNGGGFVISGGTLKIRNTILAGNSVASNGGGVACDGNVVTKGFNIIDSLNLCTGFDTDGLDHFSTDPKLDPAGLKDNGGTTTTIALLSGSLAIDAGDDATCRLFDERGLARPQGAHCDIGAYEKGGCGDGLFDPSSEGCDDGNTTSGDGCSSACVDENPGSQCGNHVLESGEQCDDGNTSNGDGCSDACAIETGSSICGDGTVDSTEECDDGNLTDGDGCSSGCLIEASGDTTGGSTTSGTTTGGSGDSGGCSLIR